MLPGLFYFFTVNDELCHIRAEITVDFVIP